MRGHLELTGEEWALQVQEKHCLDTRKPVAPLPVEKKRFEESGPRTQPVAEVDAGENSVSSEARVVLENTMKWAPLPSVTDTAEEILVASKGY